MVIHPRATLVELAERPVWWDTWLVILGVWALCGTLLLGSSIGDQALVDERERVVEALGGTVTDAQHAALLAQPPKWVYFTSGSRLLLTPVVTLAVAVGLWLVARYDGARPSFIQALSTTVHASVVLVIGQLIATPFHYVRESLTSPLNMAALLPLMEDGSVQARFFGTLDLFVLWWTALLAVGLSVLTRHRTARYALRIAAVYLCFAGVVAASLALLERS
jgi:Yip1 domain